VRSMKDLVEYIAKTIVSSPDQVNVKEEEEDGHIFLNLEVAPDDKGKVIGRQGRVVQSIRALLKVAAVKKGTRTTLYID